MHDDDDDNGDRSRESHGNGTDSEKSIFVHRSASDNSIITQGTENFQKGSRRAKRRQRSGQHNIVFVPQDDQDVLHEPGKNRKAKSLIQQKQSRRKNLGGQAGVRRTSRTPSPVLNSRTQSRNRVQNFRGNLHKRSISDPHLKGKLNRGNRSLHDAPSRASRRQKQEAGGTNVSRILLTDSGRDSQTSEDGTPTLQTSASFSGRGGSASTISGGRRRGPLSRTSTRSAEGLSSS